MKRWNNTKRCHTSGGFSLLEVMIALSLLGIGLLSLAAMQLYAIHGRSSGQHATAAAEFAQTKMAELQRRDWDWAGLADTGGAWVTANVSTLVTQESGDLAEQAFVLNWRITDDVADVTRWLDVRVTWDELHRANRAFSISSIRYNRGT